MSTDPNIVSIEPVAIEDLPKRLRPSPFDPVIDRIVAEVKPGAGWHRIGSTDPGGLRKRMIARGVKVKARRYPSDPLALFVMVD